MGLLNSQIRLMYLTQMRIDLEYKVQLITQAKMGLMSSQNDLLAMGNDLDPESPSAKMLQQRQNKLKIMEQKLDMQMQQFQARLKALDTEEQSARQMQDKAIERSFTYGGR